MITSAQAFGDQETVIAVQMNLRDEVAMQQKLLQQLPRICLLSLQQEGIEVPMSALQADPRTHGMRLDGGGAVPVPSSVPGRAAQTAGGTGSAPQGDGADGTSRTTSAS